MRVGSSRDDPDGLPGYMYFQNQNEALWEDVCLDKLGGEPS